MHSIGSKAALSILPAVLINPGDYVLMTVPGYPVFGTHAKYYGGCVYNFPLTEANHFLPDLGSVPGDVLKKAKVLVLNYPIIQRERVPRRNFLPRWFILPRKTTWSSFTMRLTQRSYLKADL